MGDHASQDVIMRTICAEILKSIFATLWYRLIVLKSLGKMQSIWGFKENLRAILNLLPQHIEKTTNR